EVLHPPDEFPALGQAAQGNIQQVTTAELKNFTLQTQLSQEMTYLSLFVLGMARRAAGDWEGAIARFSNALDQRGEQPSSGLNQSLVHFYRGLAYLSKGDHEHALADFNQTLTLQPTLAVAYANRAPIFLAKGDFSQGLADANQALTLKPDWALGYNNRGIVYLNLQDYDRAIADFSQMLKLLVEAKDSSQTKRPSTTQIGTMSQSDRELPLVYFI